MIRAIYPGSFDPVTLGHLDIIRRASKTVNELIVGVLNNGGKTPLFSIDERVEMLKEVTADIPNVKIMSFSGLLAGFCKTYGFYAGSPRSACAIQILIMSFRWHRQIGR